MASLGLCDPKPEAGGWVPLLELNEAARCTVMIDEVEVELGREF